MTRQTPHTQDDFALLRQILLPALSKATIGDFDSDLEIDSSNPQQVNELLMGVQVLLEVIRQQAAEMEATNVKLRQSTRGQSSLLLDEVLQKPLS